MNKMKVSDLILGIPKQLAFQPELKNTRRLKYADRAVLIGMGGSALAGEILKNWRPEVNLQIHRNYGLPELSDKDLKKSLLIFSSYSGNTAEVIDSLRLAMARRLHLVIITSGGEMRNIAEQEKLPFVLIPAEIPPRMAVGYSLRALLTILGLHDSLEESEAVANSLKAEDFETVGRNLAEHLKDLVPVIYATNRNFAIAYNWKIKFNETTKIPAFVNVLPELGHNEINGFDRSEKTGPLADRFGFIFLTDGVDRPEIQKRFEVLERLYRERGQRVYKVPLGAGSRIKNIFESLIVADWTAVSLANYYGSDPLATPLIEEFKKLTK